MQSTPQADILRDLVAHLRAASLPQAPRVRAALLAGYRREDLAQTTITCVPGAPDSSRLNRGSVEINYTIDVAVQRAVPTESEADAGEIRDLDWPSVEALLECQRQLLLSLYRFPRIDKIESKVSGDATHAREKGVWSSLFVVTIRGPTEPL
jgi:hypothetical protein